MSRTILYYLHKLFLTIQYYLKIKIKGDYNDNVN